MIKLVFAILVVLFMIAVLIRWILRVWRAANVLTGNQRLAHGFCPHCSYDLAGQRELGAICPECGHHFSAAEHRRLSRIAPYLMGARKHDR